MTVKVRNGGQYAYNGNFDALLASKILRWAEGEANCMESRAVGGDCSVCDCLVVFGLSGKHSDGEEVAPTCVNDGYKVCQECGYQYVTELAQGHTWFFASLDEAEATMIIGCGTCDETLITNYTMTEHTGTDCSDRSYILYSVEVGNGLATNHPNFKEIVVETREYLEEVKVHTFTDGTTTVYAQNSGRYEYNDDFEALLASNVLMRMEGEPTCDTYKMVVGDCSVCACLVVFNLSGKHILDGVDIVTPPTCLERGTTLQTCTMSSCQKQVEVDAVTATGHDYVADAAGWAAFTAAPAAGKEVTFVCDCGDTVKLVAMLKTSTIQAGCVTINKSTYTFTKTYPVEAEKENEYINRTFTRAYVVDVSSGAHTLGMIKNLKQGGDYEFNEYYEEAFEAGLIRWTEGEPFACNVKRVAGFYCSACGYLVTINLSGEHDYSAKVVNPTCEEQGYTEYNCWYCGDSYKSDYTDITDHTYDVVKYAEKWHWYTCTCGMTDLSSYEFHYGGTATETQKAICEGCGQEYGDFYDPTLTELKYTQVDCSYPYCLYEETFISNYADFLTEKSKYTKDCDLEQYDEAFFEENCLVLTSIYYSSPYSIAIEGSKEGEIYTVLIKDMSLPGSMSIQVIGYWNIAVEIPKASLDGCTTLNVETEDALIATHTIGNLYEGSESQGLEYTLSDDKTYYSVSGIGTCEDAELIIPSTYNDLPVKEIDSAAFQYYCDFTSVVIPDSITSIGSYAFENCGSLSSITVDENNTEYKSIDGNLYSKDGKTLIQYAIDKRDTEFVIPDGVTSIGWAAFESCYSLTSIEIPDSVTSIGAWAFSGCSSLTSVVIGDRVTSIGEYAFLGCNSLTGIEIPYSVMSIGKSVFGGCSSLTSVEIPNSVTTIRSRVFEGCYSLTNVVIGDSVTTIGSYAFYDCNNLTSITFKGTVEQWNAITKIENWNNEVPATEVVCSNGTAAL